MGMGEKENNIESAKPREATASNDIPVINNKIDAADVIAIGFLSFILFLIILLLSSFTAWIMLMVVLLICCYTAWRTKQNIIMLLPLILFSFIFLKSLPIWEYDRCPSDNTMSRLNLRHIGMAMMLYSSANDDRYPPNLELLVEEGCSNEKTFRNPKLRYDPPKIINGKFVGEVGYVVFLDFPENASGNMIMAYEKLKYALPDKVAVLLLSGCIENMTAEELNAQLKAEGRPPAE